MGQPAAASGVKKVFGAAWIFDPERHEISLAVFGFGPGRVSKSKESAVLAGSFASPTLFAVSGSGTAKALPGKVGHRKRAAAGVTRLVSCVRAEACLSATVEVK
jgi:hypothetical protein